MRSTKLFFWLQLRVEADFSELKSAATENQKSTGSDKNSRVPSNRFPVKRFSDVDANVGNVGDDDDDNDDSDLLSVGGRWRLASFEHGSGTLGSFLLAEFFAARLEVRIADQGLELKNLI